jgi:CheY-like chemotaxis protein
MCPARKRQILVVDDDAIVCETVMMILQIDGHVVHSANSGAQALALFEPGKFDLIITDFFMPAMTGEKLAAAIKTQSPTQPVVMLTAYPEKLSRENPQAIDLLLGKPFEINALRDAVTRCVPAQRPASASS